MSLVFSHFDKHPVLRYGFSEKSDGSMWLGLSEQEIARTAANRTKFFAKVGIPAERVVAARLAHGTQVAVIEEKDSGRVVDETDGLVTSTQNLFLSVTGADCFPLYFFDSDACVVGIAHLGWRGVVGDIVGRAIKVLQKNFKISPQNLLVGIGPGIRACHFDIKPENARFYKTYPDAVRIEEDRIFVDLVALIEKQLQEGGVRKGNIEDCGQCTFCLGDIYYSWRRDRPRGGVNAMVAYVGLLT
ncbi:MAG: hypothetical protein A3F26_02535 [Candidatus Ryanbacteria bacterium RIFCSPHIGHO2_12_FULL_47_12b]|uniref:Purine nucleoside phosphorylase n=3 Tax=Parcubacteria group TaxID=1794811 RepID=A0A1G2H4M4_9BACT|nr:MAG: Multi-copper polyphenol oxidoreductase, laccase [Parcubacteria group bacterium GW2011_GWA2_47_10b]KKU76279.1 MAG: Multi-copper polyphenol oxidoreductase, laccase [Candidatus Giovannonibacteria bacterium GW2011_GWB1_47_6b]OGZ44380.1 MAG: hypothetical protein A2844_01570 [Candidatus Ryanbacteria bacterium RIFCSPHIGHO2_01_FULL_48_80]OGZ48026.1 MAG: hypothetical protein A3C83_01430 [Candidatus Ryanbacteria bacterium RIFCSPHIGHO2_02_FULL_47_25]OGZ52408.1 MAG: hypothetical protein A3F26_02535